MKHKLFHYVAMGGIHLWAFNVNAQQAKINLPKDSVLAIVKDAYLYALPLVFTDATRIKTNIPDNTFQHLKVFPDYTFKAVVAPNNDTNYSLAFLELQDDAVVITIPDTKGRYYVVPFLDGWTNNFKLVGKRTTGTKPQQYVITGPNWKGELPKGIKQIKSPTNLVWVIGRIQVNGKEDQKNFVAPLQDQFGIATLSNWKNKSANINTVAKKRYDQWTSESFKNGVTAAIQHLSFSEFFNYFNALVKDNPPAVADSAIVKRIATIGVGANLHFSVDDFDAATSGSFADYKDYIYKNLRNFKGDGTGIVGDFATNYPLRASVAYYGLGALPQQEATYYDGKADAAGNPLDGKNNYVIHYAKGQLPPTQAFWSLTVYDKDRYLSQNPINRYAIGDRDKLKYNADGSLDIYVGHQQPEESKISNWLPAPDDVFYLTLRIYVPKESLVKDKSSWNNPLPRKIN